ncbi:MAG: hypothetical protein IKS37_10920 [Solobacterium sp.]|nr:hypothetical protein [Solobacterium sp.]
MLNAVLILILLCEVWGLTYAGWRYILKSMMFYTQLSNAAAFFSALALLVFGQQPWITAFRYLSVCMLMMTIFVLVPTMKDTRLLLWSRAGFFLHILCPLLNLVSYLFLEAHAGKSMIIVPVLVTLVYGDIMLYFNYQRKVDGPYPFLRVYHQSKRATVLWFTALLCVIVLFASAVMAVS